MFFGSITQNHLAYLNFLKLFLCSLENLLYDAFIIFQKDDDNFEIEHKTC